MAARIDTELDLHGHTAASARALLESAWSRGAWQNMHRVRIIHGTGAVLYRMVRQWADDKSIPWTLETYNPGVTILQPALRRPQAQVQANRPFARYKEKLGSVVRAKPVSVEERATPVPPIIDPQASDLFAAEIERLDKQDPRSLHKKKHGA